MGVIRRHIVSPIYSMTDRIDFELLLKFWSKSDNAIPTLVNINLSSVLNFGMVHNG